MAALAALHTSPLHVADGSATFHGVTLFLWSFKAALTDFWSTLRETLNRISAQHGAAGWADLLELSSTRRYWYLGVLPALITMSAPTQYPHAASTPYARSFRRSKESILDGHQSCKSSRGSVIIFLALITCDSCQPSDQIVKGLSR